MKNILKNIGAGDIKYVMPALVGEVYDHPRTRRTDELSEGDIAWVPSYGVEGFDLVLCRVHDASDGRINRCHSCAMHHRIPDRASCTCASECENDDKCIWFEDMDVIRRCDSDDQTNGYIFHRIIDIVNDESACE